jgi:hypothetical protein
MEDFMSVDNLRALVNILEDFIKDKHGLSTIQANIKEILFKIMLEMKKKNITGTLLELNKAVLSRATSIVKEIIHNENNMKGGDAGLPYLSPPQISTPPSSYSKNTENSSGITQEYEKLMQNRIIEEKKPPMKMKPALKIDALEKTDYMKKYENQINLRKLTTETDIHNPSIVRSQDDVSAIVENPLPSNKELYEQKTPIEGFDEPEKSSIHQILDYGLPIDISGTKLPSSSKPTIHYVTIDSSDRNWILNRNRYSFSVNLSHTTETIEKVPYFANNPTIPHSVTTVSNGLPNTNGWFSDNGTFYPPYNASDPSGQDVIIGYEEKIFVTNTNSYLLYKYQNISGIYATSVVIPIDAFKAPSHACSIGEISSTHSADGHVLSFNFPYINLHIEEFNNVCDGTGDALRKSFCKLHYDCHYICPNGRGYIILKPSQNETKNFYPTYINSLPRLTISVTKPNGDLISNNLDGQAIMRILYDGTNRFYLQIVTSRYFEKNAYLPGDIVRIHNFKVHHIDECQDSNHIANFNNFINKENGHEVTGLGEPNDNGYYRTFYIRGPGSFDDSVGSFIPEDHLIEQLDIFNRIYDYSQTPECEIVNGNIMNLSMQFTLSLTIQTMDPECNSIPEPFGL